MKSEIDYYQKEWNQLQREAKSLQESMTTMIKEEKRWIRYMDEFKLDLPDELLLEDGIVREASTKQYFVVQVHHYFEGYDPYSVNKIKWELTDALQHDLQILSTYLTDYIHACQKTGENPEMGYMNKKMFRTLLFQKLTHHAFGHQFSHLPKEKRHRCTGVDVLTQLLALATDEKQKRFNHYQEIAATMGGFASEARSGKPFTFTKDHGYTFEHDTRLTHPDNIGHMLFRMSMMNEKEFSLL